MSLEILPKKCQMDKNERATLYILDEPDQIKRKFLPPLLILGLKLSPPEKLGITNLLSIHSLSGISLLN